MKDLGAWHDKLHWPLQTPRGDRRQDRLHLHRVLLAEAAADIRRDDLDLVCRQAERRHEAVPDGFGVLRAFVNGEIAVMPFGDGGNQLDRVLMLGRRGEASIDLDRRLGKRLVRIAGDHFGDEALERRVGLVDRFHARGIERHADRLGSVGRLDQCGCLDRGFERLGRHQRDRLAAIGDGRREHRLQALKAVASGHYEAGGFHIAEVLMREDQPHP